MSSQAPSISREEILAAYPLERVLDQYGIELSRQSGRLMCRCPFHADGTPSMDINLTKGVWNCYAGCGGGSSIDFIARMSNEDPKATYGRLARELTGSMLTAPIAAPKPKADQPRPAAASPEKPADKWPTRKDTPVAVYTYQTLFGSLAYEVLRFERANPEKASGKDKTFRQRHKDKEGNWVHNMDGVERVLYRLPEIASSPVVWICEGEKDADNLTALGLVTTCNVGGAGKWLDGYTDSLAGKDIAICGDNDQPGKDHVELVFQSVSKKAKSVRLIRLPEAIKDASDFIATFETVELAKKALEDLFHSATPFIQGHKIPLYSFVEMEQRYKFYIQKIEEQSFSLAGWLPALSPLRRLVPGDLVTFLAGTGVGKTSILTNIAIHARPIPTLFFELELPDASMFERFVGIECGLSGRQVEEGYKVQDEVGPTALQTRLGHVHICPEAAISISDLESIIVRSELKTGTKPQIVLLDYIQLMKGNGKSRYEQRSSVAEDLKSVAKSTQTIIVLSSQIGRREEGEDPTVGLSDGKESGSIENSSGVVIGAWRDLEEPSVMIMRVLKATKGGAGIEVRCRYNLQSLRITQLESSTP